MKPTLVSGIQPSGRLNIGHYLGALKNWATLQEDHDCLYFLADLHAITVRQDPDELRNQSYETLALYIACGIAPEQNTLFCQSHVPQNAEFAWVLNCFTYMGELSRMTQFKEKSKKGGNISVGLFDYPVLQAADVLLYKANIVPVGADQKQHLELARDLAIRFNNIYGEILTVPEPYIPKMGARIMALQEPTQKMSKSDPNLNNTITLLDEPKTILKKLKRSVTDSETEIRFHESKPGVSNLLTIHSCITGKTIGELEQEYSGMGYGKLKTDLAEIVIQFLEPVQKKYYELRGDETQLAKILKNGAERAKQLAQPMLDKIHALVGFIPE